MSQPALQQFPISYRIAQGGLAISLALMFNIRTLFNPNVPIIVRSVAGTILGVVVLIALFAGYYVIIRYPFLSLVEVEGGDRFDQKFQSANGRVYFVLKLLSTIVVAILLMTIALMGFDNIRQLAMFSYLATTLGFLAFFTFIYHPIKHPTVSTFIRATLGLGIFLFPFFLPAILIGSRRCNRLLKSVGDQ